MIGETLIFEDFELDVARRELRRGGIRVEVGPQSFDLLVHLVRNRHRVVDKDDMIASVWNGRIVSDSTLTSQINAVRKALGDTGEAQRLIRTVPRKGVRFVGEILRATPDASPSVKPAAIEPPPVPDRPTVAVMPFANLGGDPAQEYFADGMTDDVITALSKWRSFHVVARNSTFAYKGRAVDVRSVGLELGARYVLEGSVRKADGRLRIGAQLIETGGGAHVWAERYDVDLADVFAVQDDLSRRIAAAVEPEVGRHEQRLSSKKPPTDLDAWDCVHRGMHLLYKFTRRDIAAARPLFERAIALDPGFSRAHTSLAYSHQLDLLHGYAEDREHSLGQLLRHALAGVKLDDTDSYAHVILSFAYARTRKHDLAVAAARRATELNPSDAWALGTYGHALDLAGRPVEALETIERMLKLTPRDPHQPLYHAVAARVALNARDYADAERRSRFAIELDATQARPYMLLAIALAYLGRTEEARDALALCESAQPGYAAMALVDRPYRRAADNEHLAEGLRRAGFHGAGAE